MDNVGISPTSGPANQYNFFNSSFSGNPFILIALTVIVLVYVVGIGTLGSGFGKNVSVEVDQEAPGLKLVEIIMWGVFIFLLMMNAVQYFFSVDITASIKNLFTEKPQIDLTIVQDQPDPVAEMKAEKQVFHIPGNEYTYENAKALCAAYGAKLADIKQVQKSHHLGGEWCSYGWSDNQMALFPTQEETYKKLQTIPGHENDCGRPGVNGGYIDNPNVRFGVNCYGYKPEITSRETQKMASQTSKFPKTQKEIEFEKRVDVMKRKIPDILVAPFNDNSWSKV